MIKRVLVVGLCLLCILQGCMVAKPDKYGAVQQATQKSKFTVEENKYFEVNNKSTEDAQLYEYVIYNKDGEVVRKEEVGREPHVVLLQNGLLEIMTSHGSSAQLYRYYDVTNNVFSSEAFWNRSLVLDDGKIVYMDFDEDNNIVLVIQDIFDKSKYYKEIRRDFSPFAVPCMVLKTARIVEKENLEITYYQGDAQRLVSEIISLR